MYVKVCFSHEEIKEILTKVAIERLKLPLDKQAESLVALNCEDEEIDDFDRLQVELNLAVAPRPSQAAVEAELWNLPVDRLDLEAV